MKLPREALSRLYNKFKAAIDGIIVGLKTDRSIRVQWLIAIAVLVIFFVIGIEPSDWLWVILLAGLVVAIEHINSAIEELADFVEPQYSEHIKRIKDFSSAAVFILSITSAIVGLIILFKYL
ncbi:MAG: diacylglycerol kinase family protein [Erysipelotrichaceae bacterium]|nr:diacylglycerol kinase family protein [Erysipelotrichaceae bacterium]